MRLKLARWRCRATVRLTSCTTTAASLRMLVTVALIHPVGNGSASALDPKPADATGAALLQCAATRRSNRSKYRSTAIPDEFVTRLANIATEHGTILRCIKDTSTRLALSELQYMADRAVIALSGFRQELAGYFLPNDSTAKRGMPGDTFGLSAEVAQQIHTDLASPGLFNPDWAAGFAAAGRDGIRSAPLVCVFSAKEDAPLAWIAIGRCFLQAVLAAEQAGLAAAVHASMVESRALNAMLRARLLQAERPTMVFRVGYAEERRPRSPRVSIDELIVGLPPQDL